MKVLAIAFGVAAVGLAATNNMIPALICVGLACICVMTLLNKPS